MIDVREFCRSFAEGFDREFFKHRPPFMSRRAFALGAVLWWGFLFSLLYAATSLAQVAGVCGAGKACSVSKLNVTNAAGRSVCVGLPSSGLSAEWQMSSTVLGLRSMNGPQCATANSEVFQWNLSSGLAVANFDFTSLGRTAAVTGFCSGPTCTGTAIGSFPTCTAGLSGRLLYDSTNNVWRTCNGATWLAMTPVVSTGGQYLLHGVWTATATQAVSAAPEGVHFLGAFRPRAAPASPPPRADIIACNWQTAGAGGTTGVVVEVWNQTDGTQVCQCTLGSCTTTARDPLICGCEQNLLADKTYTVRLTSGTDCTTNPSGVVCSVHLVPGF